jgi:acid stress-induced BolA-like protein IbaG/YrbA
MLDGMMTMDALRAWVLEIVPGAEVSIRDLTGGGDHFEATVVSPRFEGKSLLDRHQMVQGPLRPAIEDGRIHALSLKTYTPEQWRKRQGA